MTKKPMKLQELQELIVLDPENEKIKPALHLFNTKWEAEYNALRSYQVELRFIIPKDEQTAHQQRVRNLIAAGCSLYMLNRELSRQPKADTKHHVTAGHQYNAIKALQITERAFSEESKD